MTGVHWTDDNQVEQIKFHVDSDTKLVISRCKTMAEVWEVLDSEFAQEEEIINCVNSELKALRLMDCSVHEYIVKLRKHLPNLEDALESVEGLDHLQNPDRVNYLTSKFDERTLEQWDYFRSKATGKVYDRFFEFLKDRYEASKSAIARSKSVSLVATIPPPLQSIHSSSVDSTSCRRCRTWVAREQIYECPGCGRGTAVNEKVEHCLEHCAAYMRMSVNERSSCVEAAKWCPIHLINTHELAKCNMTNASSTVCGKDNCTKHHHKSLHGSTTTFVASIHVTNTLSVSGDHSSHDNSHATSNNVLLSIQSIETTGSSITCMFDNCATCCLISSHCAERLGCKGIPTDLFITTCRGTNVVESFSYLIPLYDNNNECHFITAYEVETISNDICEVDISGVKHLFSSEIQDRWSLLEDRPTGEIELLLGTNVLKLHPFDYNLTDNMKVLSSIFGSGFVLTGSHPAIKSGELTWNVSQQEMDMWEGPIHYVSLQHVLNPDSATTPLRIVTNSSLSNQTDMVFHSTAY